MISNYCTLLPVVISLTLLPGLCPGQVENPAVESVQEVLPSATIQSVRANIIPLIWKATIDASTIAVPLRSIEYFGVQDYDVDGATRVRELTITTNSQSMIRIYHIRPLAAVTETTRQTVETLRNVAEGVAKEELNLPVKIFPATTHSHMVEYRTDKEGDIDELYQHLESVMLEYMARDLIPEQRGETLREIKTSK